ncbi:MAG: glycosyltransferase [Muribaculaceae bacterium]|nr:glycosyltransferase [Muribaculaceae bacterium]
MISVVIPAYNASQWLDECLDSIAGQDCGETEIIVVDDGSTDSTPLIAASHPGVRVITTKNQGQASARNVGIREAKGEWIAFVDADDKLFPHALSAMLEIAENTGADVVTAGFTSSEHVTPRRHSRQSCADGRTALINTLYQNIDWHCSVWAKLMRTNRVRQTMFVDGLYYEDLEFISRLYMLNGIKVCSTDQIVYHYRTNPDSFIHRFTSSRLDVLTVTEGIEQRAAGDEPLLRAARSRRLSACFNMYLLTCRLPKYSTVNRKCLSEIRRLRKESLTNPRVRLKNKAGILLSYLLNPLL